MAKKQRGLGKGLDAIFGDNFSEESSPAGEIRISEIEPNRNQPRKDFDDEALQELADSISQHGVIQPLILRPMHGGGYQIVAGERRWRASRMAGLQTVPAVIKDLSDEEVMEMALIENLQREDLNPVEEAMGYAVLMNEHELTQEEVSKAVGKSRSAIANSMRLLKLPEAVLKMISDGELSAGHARALLALPEEIIEDIAEKVIKEELSVRETEKLVKLLMTPQKEPEIPERIPYYKEVQFSLHDYLKRKVTVNGNSKKGTLQIEFYGRDDLEELLRILNLNN